MKPKKLLDLKNCLKCKECCCRFEKGYEDCSPFFTQGELQRIGAWKNKSKWRKFGDSYRTKLVSSKNQKELICPFFNEEKSFCLIEKRKPLDCIIFPFVFIENKKGTAVDLAYYDLKYCSGLKEITQKELNDYKKYLADFCETIAKQKILGISMDFDPKVTFVKEILKI